MLGDLLAENASQLVHAASDRFLSHGVLALSQLQVEFAVSLPLRLTSHVDECGEVNRCVEGNVFGRRLLGRVDEEVDDAVVNRLLILEASDEGPNVLESSTTHDL